MKCYLLMLAATLAWCLVETMPLAAQVYGAGGYNGAFNYRPIGAPIATIGEFGYRQIGGPSYPITTTGAFGTQTIGGSSFGMATTGAFGTRFMGSALNSYANGIAAGAAANVPYFGQTITPLSPAALPTVPPSAQGPEMSNPNNEVGQPMAPEVGQPPTAQPAWRSTAPQPVQPSPQPAENGTEGATPGQQAPRSRCLEVRPR